MMSMRQGLLMTVCTRSKLSPPVISLVVANLVPVSGLLFWDLHLYPILILYWLESIVIGVFTILKMLCNTSPGPAKIVQKIVMIPFFMFHFGIFLCVHGLILVEGFGPHYAQLDSGGEVFGVTSDRGLVFALAGLFCSHVLSFFWHYLRGKEYQQVSLMKLSSKPYPRVIFMQVFLIFGGLLIFQFGLKTVAILLLLLLKITVDLFSHLSEHRCSEVRPELMHKEATSTSARSTGIRINKK